MASEKILGQGKWLRLVERDFTDANGKVGRWEFATRGSNGRTVCMIAVKPSPTPTLVLVKQFRAAIDGWIVEFPAGLVDEGESAQQAALRELAEETGYIGNVVNAGPFTYNSPGLTDESVACVRIETTGSGDHARHTDEVIEVIEAPLAGLIGTLRSIESGGVKIDAKLWAFAQGLAFGLTV